MPGSARIARTRVATIAASLLAATLLMLLVPVVAGAAWTAGGRLPGLGTGRIWSVAASPARAGTVLAGTDRGVYLSTDSGAHWAATHLTGVRVWSVGFDLRAPQRIVAGTDGRGVETSTDGGATWTAVTTGLPSRSVRTLAFGLDGIAAGTTRGVALSPDGTAWHGGGLDGYSVSALVVVQNSPNLVLVAGVDSGNISNGSLFRSGGNVNGWQALQSGLPTAASVSSLSAGPLTATVTRHPLLVTTSKGTFRSGDTGTTWTPVTGVPDTVSLTTVAYSPLDPNLAFAGADVASSTGGALFRSVDSGVTWKPADDGLSSKTRQVETLAIEQTTPPVILAGLDPASGGITYTLTDTAAPAPPALVAEAPGAPIPATLATPAAPAKPTPQAPTAPRPAPPSGAVAALLAAVHWPLPLLLEVLLLGVIVFLVVRWRQRYYIEGPP